MQNKENNLLLPLIAGVFVFLVVILNIGVLARGRVSLRGEPKGETRETEAVLETEEETDAPVAAAFENFRIDRSGEREDEKKKKEEKTNAPSENYLCPASIVRVLDDEDVEELLAGDYEGFPDGKDIIQMVINEIYARNGYRFEDEELMSYFSGKEWYRENDENPNDMDAIYEGMSDIDKANIDFLKDKR